MMTFRVCVTILYNLKLSTSFKHLRKYSEYKTKLYLKTSLFNEEKDVNKLIKKCAPKLIYNSVVENKVLKYDHHLKKLKKEIKRTISTTEPVPLTLKYLSEEITVNEEEAFDESNLKPEDEKLVNFPYEQGYNVEEIVKATSLNEDHNEVPDPALKANEEVRKRFELQKEIKNWMVAYDNYDDRCLAEEDEDLIFDPDVENWKINYGTPDPKSIISNIPCGGCGALLHCKDTAIPGYIPSEIFKNSFEKGGASLDAIICQRCHFLKYYNLALQVQVKPEDYPKVLATVREKGGLVILMVDLLDFPCSIWPGIGEIFGPKTPIVVVGNKVDLLPQDGKNFLQNIKSTLLNTVKLQGFATFNIKDVALISAKTGFGVEDLITKLGSLYNIKGDVYIVGTTNVGKSSLFNAFLQSDYCKVQAVDLIQRATTSVWPGTTLNLLKFPIKRPVGYRQFLRHKRLQAMYKLQEEENRFRKEQLRKTRDPKYATLIGNIDITKNPYSEVDSSKDYFMLQGHSNAAGKLKMGIDETKMEFVYGKWCYDTPGVVQPDQLIHLLTTEELLLTLPKDLILPRTFCIKPKSTLYIAGLARLDYVNGPTSVRLTVFASNELPITICETRDAEYIYQELLGSDLFKVPTGNAKRIKVWPQLELAQSFTIKGISWNNSSNDVVLSSAGWIAITGREDLEYEFQAWTPEKRGVFIRDCLLPRAVALAGTRIKHSVAYHKHRFFLQ